MNLKYFLIASSLVFFAKINNCEQEEDDSEFPMRYDNYSVLRITPQTDEQLRLLMNYRNEHHELDFWTEPSGIYKPFDLMISPENFDKIKILLEENEISFYVLIDDVQKLIDEESEDLDDSDNSEENYRDERTLLVTFFNRYHRTGKIHKYLKKLKAQYSFMMSLRNIGFTFHNKRLKLVKIGINSNQTKPIIWIDAGIHARERITPATALYFIYKLLSRYGIDDDVTHLVDTFDWYIMPLINPDGYDHTFKVRMWRKNRSKSAVHSEGVDLNRNFPYGWNNSYVPASGQDPNSEDYIGPYALSENETEAMARVLSENKDRIKLYISLHSYGQLIMFPWGYKPDDDIEDYEELKTIGEKAAEEIKTVYGTEYSVGSISKILYPAPGCAIDWTYGELKIKHSYSFELRDKGEEGFLLNKKHIVTVGEETWKGVQSMAYSIAKQLQ